MQVIMCHCSKWILRVYICDDGWLQPSMRNHRSEVCNGKVRMDENANDSACRNIALASITGLVLILRVPNVFLSARGRASSQQHACHIVWSLTKRARPVTVGLSKSGIWHEAIDTEHHPVVVFKCMRGCEIGRRV